ncbi:MAG: hypothetical protein QGG87_01415 [Nitrospinota bacterium]|nr:hypothetical protein [Nitrospinota bacterium]
MINHSAASCRDHNSVKKTELDGFRWKSALRVEDIDVRDHNFIRRIKLDCFPNGKLPEGLRPWMAEIK